MISASDPTGDAPAPLTRLRPPPLWVAQSEPVSQVEIDLAQKAMMQAEHLRQGPAIVADSCLGRLINKSHLDNAPCACEQCKQIHSEDLTLDLNDEFSHTSMIQVRVLREMLKMWSPEEFASHIPYFNEMCGVMAVKGFAQGWVDILDIVMLPMSRPDGGSWDAEEKKAKGEDQSDEGDQRQTTEADNTSEQDMNLASGVGERGQGSEMKATAEGEVDVTNGVADLKI